MRSRFCVSLVVALALMGGAACGGGQAEDQTRPVRLAIDRLCASTQEALSGRRPIPKSSGGLAWWVRPFESLLRTTATDAELLAARATRRLGVGDIPELDRYLGSVKESSATAARLEEALERRDVSGARGLLHQLREQGGTQRRLAQAVGLTRCREGAGVAVLFDRVPDLLHEVER